MSLFKSAKLDQCYLKAGLYGEAGSGKSFTSSLIAIGLHKLIKSTKPVTFYDTENGASYLLPILFQPAKIDLMVIKSMAFSDLMTAMEEAQKISDIFIIDSISAVWTELQEAFKKKNNITRLEFQHWGILKPEWQRFTQAFLNSPLHILVNGRAKDDFEYIVGADGKRELQKTGTRMQSEKNLSYEPSLLIELEKIQDPKTGFWIPRAWILKDRFNQIDGKAFDNPTFETILPHIRLLNLGGVQEGIDTTRNSEALFSSDDGQAIAEVRRKQRIWAEEVESTLTAAYPGRSADETKKKLELLKMAFGGYSWELIQGMAPERLQEGLLKIREKITKDLETPVEEKAKKGAAK